MTPDAGADSGDAHVPGLELEQADVYGRYMLTSRVEILFVLRAMQKRGCLATVYFDHGRAFFLTTLLAVDAEGNTLTLDPGSDPATNQAALKATRLILSASLDRVKIQFALAGLWAATAEGQPAFGATLPDALLRLQRREYFRLETPLAHPLRCQIPLPQSGGEAQTLELQLLDISGGGVSLMVPESVADFLPVGCLLPDCRIHLPDEGLVAVTLCVRSAFGVTTRSGHSYIRVGCEFVSLPGFRLTLIQRYITRTERERKARQSGLE